MTGGYDAETDDSLRARYYVAVLTPATSANKNQYVAWAESVPGVGGAKCYPLANGANTVGICIIDSNHQPASAELVAAVQVYIDPGSAGIGEGAAPIGAYCTVTSATGLAINMTFGDISDSSEYERLFDKLTEDTEFHTIVVPGTTGMYTYTAYITGVKDKLVKYQSDGKHRWGSLEASFTAKTPVRG